MLSGRKYGMKIFTENSKITKKYGKEISEMAKDPVCKMEVDEKMAPATSEYKGRTYYFCAPGCKKMFDENPAKYTEDIVS